jgi:drug/metabolite transporter (DMT)-like permease
VASLLALSGAVLWGVGDFLGGVASRRLAVLTVLALSQAVGLAGVALWVWLASDPFPGRSEILPAAAAGVAGLIGLGALYRGLAVGAMGIVAPISAASPLVPLAVDAGRVGAFDTGANVCVAFATTKGTAGIVAVLSALYPIVTVVLARLVLAERLSAARRVGGVIALAGAALVAAG